MALTYSSPAFLLVVCLVYLSTLQPMARAAPRKSFVTNTTTLEASAAHIMEFLGHGHHPATMPMGTTQPAVAASPNDPAGSVSPAASSYKKFQVGFGTTPRSAQAEKDIRDSKRTYASKKNQLSSRATRTYASGIVAAAKIQVGAVASIYPNAAEQLAWFLGNTCNPYLLDFSAMAEDDCCAQNTYGDLNAVLEAAEVLVAPGDTTYIRTTTETQQVAESGDWFWSVHGYRTWTRARVSRAGDEFSMEVMYNMRDMYDWDEGSWAPGGLVVDGQMSQLHYWGLACEYEVSGSVWWSIDWEKGQRF